MMSDDQVFSALRELAGDDWNGGRFEPELHGLMQRAFDLGRKDAGQSSGGVSIQKVEIVVTSSESPERIARAVRAELVKLGGVGS